ncbi:MAG: toll/interleukin-1 receptor domain-containing protein [Bacteroidota bacterium]
MNGYDKVFISHSSFDKAFTDKLVEDLISWNIPVWYDKFDIKIGESITGKINSGLQKSKYFAIVLSENAINSAWVNEELNAALIKQIHSKGTFIIPLVIDDVEIPPLLAHRRFVDFREDYEMGLNSILSLLELDATVSQSLSKKKLFPWPDFSIPDEHFLFLHSHRFDKFFRMNCDFNWSVDHTITYIVDTLKLPWKTEEVHLGINLYYSYGLMHNEEELVYNKSLDGSSLKYGDKIMLNISGKIEDLYLKELNQIWEGKKVFDFPARVRKEKELKNKIKARGSLDDGKIHEVMSSRFNHI